MSMGEGYRGIRIPKYHLDRSTLFEMFHHYHQPPGTGYAAPRARWQYWWFRRAPRNRHLHDSKPKPLVHTGNPKGTTAICLVFLGIFCVILGLFMAGFGYSYPYKFPLQIVGPLLLGLGSLMMLIGIILCLVVRKELSSQLDTATSPAIVMSESEEKNLPSSSSLPTVHSPPVHLVSINGTSVITDSPSSPTRSPHSPLKSPDNGYPPCSPSVIITPPEGAQSPKAIRLPFQPVGPAFRISEKDLRAASMERLNEIDQNKKKAGHLDDISLEIEERENRRENRRTQIDKT